MRRMRTLVRYVPLAIGLVLLTIGAAFVPWSEVGPYLRQLTPLNYLLIAGLGVAYYLARIIRYHYMLNLLGEPRSFRRTMVAYFEAQPVSLLPGGEAFRTLTLKKQVNVPLSKGVPVVFVQSFTENIGLVLLALVSALILQQQVLVVLVLALLYLVILVLIRTRRTAEHSRRLLNKLPFVSLARTKFMKFIHRNRKLLSGWNMAVLLLSGMVSTLIAATLIFLIGNDMGISLTFTESIIAYALPMVLQNVTFLPGGIGVNEQGSVGILVVLGAAFPAAVALTIVIRLVTLGLGVVLGLGAIALAKLHPRLES